MAPASAILQGEAASAVTDVRLANVVATPVVLGTLRAEVVSDAAPAADPRSEAERGARTSPPAACAAVAPRVEAVADWLFCARRALFASSGSALFHLAVMIALGRLWAADFGLASGTVVRPVLQSTQLELPRPTPELPPTEFKLNVAVAPQPGKQAHGLGSAGVGGGRGGGAVGGTTLAGLSLGPPQAAGGTRGLGTDAVFGQDLLGDVGETPSGATFFGVRAEGTKFCFVVDTSGSMAQNSRFLRCRHELLRSISSLHYRQQYYICFFNHLMFAMPENKLVEARPVQLRKTSKWIKSALPAGFTNPWPGLQQALEMKPDAIYLLTDGEFDPAVMQWVIAAQPQSKKIPIHTIAFESQAGEPTLKTISRVTNGVYRYVP